MTLRANGERSIAALVVLATVYASGCNYQKLTNPEPTTPLPKQFTDNESSVPDKPRDARWWNDFNDPQLTALISEALEDNYTVRGGWARVRQAKHLARQARAARFPQVLARGSAQTGNTLQAALGTFDSTTVVGSLPVSYEVDVFARRARAHQGAKLDAEAAALDQSALAITIAAEVAETWFDVIDTHVQRDVLTRQLETEQQFFELVELRYKQGLTDIVDVHQQGQRVASAQSMLSTASASASVSVHRLASLLGDAPNRAFELDQAKLPEIAPLPDVEPPAAVVEQRPDIVAAKRRVEAADRRVAAEVGARLPQITLSYTPNYTWVKSDVPSGFTMGQDTAGGSTTTNHGFTWTAGAQLSVPIFDGRLGKARIDAQRSLLDQSLDDYENTIITALVEVENARVLEKQQHLAIHHLEEQLKRATAGLDATQRRYREGLTDFLPVFTALATKQSAELTLLAARRLLVGYRVQLYRALGGVWPDEFREPER